MDTVSLYAVVVDYGFVRLACLVFMKRDAFVVLLRTDFRLAGCFGVFGGGHKTILA